MDSITKRSPQEQPSTLTSARNILRWRSRLWVMGLLFVVLALAIALGTSVGSANVPFFTVWEILLSKISFPGIHYNGSSNTETIILEIRLPRVILAGLVGASLSVAGATYQGLFRNPLADPYLVGVSQGALLGAVIGFLMPEISKDITDFGVVPTMAFIGGMGAVIVVYLIAKSGSRALPVTTLILGGVALGAWLSAISHYLMLQSDDGQLHAIVSWMFGHIDDEWRQVLTVLPFTVIGTVVIWLHARPLNVMQLDEEQAQQLGIDVERVKLILLACSTMITAISVAFCGIIGFVGIIVPHTVRIIWGPDHRFLLPLSTLVGAIFLILADVVVRSITDPESVPIGVITASVGAPFFLFLLWKRKRGTYF